jgi:hypothetical protein
MKTTIITSLIVALICINSYTQTHVSSSNEEKTPASSRGSERLVPPQNHQPMPEVIPIGTVVAYAGLADSEHLPAGWLPCDGTVLDPSNKRYRKLFHVIGSIYGGDSVTSFKIPDMRGMFIRGYDDNQANKRVDPETERKLGSVQKSCLSSHSHRISNLWLSSKPQSLTGLSRACY